jgi:hypothetical protein
MTINNLCTTELMHLPSVKILLLKAALKKNRFYSQKNSEITLPIDKFYCDNVVFNESSYKRYHQVVNWDNNSEFMHPCYLHSLAFPLHLKLLLLPDFIFPLIGLIHVKNRIKQTRPIKKLRS